MNWIECILIAIVAYVYHFILTEQGMILGWWFNLCKKLPVWLFEPLVGCIYCVTGQIAFWFYLINYFHHYVLIHHILYICVSIFIVDILVTTKNKLK